MIATQTPEDSVFPQGPCQLSYAAGSTSLEPGGYRVIGHGDHGRIGELVQAFPSLGQVLNDRAMIISAYPAALGIQTSVPFVDTYLHAPTLIRSLRLATQQERSVVFAAQPLAGADLLIKMLNTPYGLPKRMLWAAGGYYFPASLETYMTQQLADRGCQLDVLHCYGVAEVGHTCFAATHRDELGEPLYRLVASDVLASVDDQQGSLVLSREGRSICTGDYAQAIGDHWLIRSSAYRLASQVRREIESWRAEQWVSRTGYLRYESDRFTFQLREGHQPNGQKTLLSFHQFWERHGGSLQSKPTWQSFESTGESLLLINFSSDKTAKSGPLQEFV
ncbi:hypothetical protein N9N28_03765 [Rubripirellula amarantea]|nr:hypothetical protein [Rubripirellula amarantea]